MRASSSVANSYVSLVYNIRPHSRTKRMQLKRRNYLSRARVIHCDTYLHSICITIKQHEYEFVFLRWLNVNDLHLYRKLTSKSTDQNCLRVYFMWDLGLCSKRGIYAKYFHNLLWLPSNRVRKTRRKVVNKLLVCGIFF